MCILLRICEALGIFKLMFYTHWGSLGPLFIQITFCPLLSLYFLDSNTNIGFSWYHRPLSLCFFSSILFIFVVWALLIYLSVTCLLIVSFITYLIFHWYHLLKLLSDNDNILCHAVSFFYCVTFTLGVTSSFLFLCMCSNFWLKTGHCRQYVIVILYYVVFFWGLFAFCCSQQLTWLDLKVCNTW